MQVCTSLQTDNHASTPPLSFLQAGCPSCRPTNSVKALKALLNTFNKYGMQWDMRFNPQKSQLACFGGNYPRDNIITLGDIYLCWSAQIKYLGCCFRCKQRAVDPSSFTGRFYGTFNNILNVMGNSQNEMSAQYLIQTHYLLSLMYSCETRNFEFV